MLPHHADGYEEDQLLMKGSQPSENFANTAEEPQPHETNDFTQNAFTTTSQFLDVQDNAVPEVIKILVFKPFLINTAHKVYKKMAPMEHR